MKQRFQIKKPSDWGKVTIQQVEEAGGATLIKNYYESSLFKALTSVYPGIPSLSFNSYRRN